MVVSIPLSPILKRVDLQFLEERDQSKIFTPFLAVFGERQERVELCGLSAVLHARLRRQRAVIVPPAHTECEAVYEWFGQKFPELPVHCEYVPESADPLRAKVVIITARLLLKTIFTRSDVYEHIVMLDPEELVPRQLHIFEVILAWLRKARAKFSVSWITRFKVEDPRQLRLGYDGDSVLGEAAGGVFVPSCPLDPLPYLEYLLLAQLYSRAIGPGQLLREGGTPYVLPSLDETTLRVVLDRLRLPKEAELVQKMGKRFKISELGVLVAERGILPQVHRSILASLGEESQSMRVLEQIYDMISSGTEGDDLLCELLAVERLEGEEVAKAMQQLKRYFFRKTQSAVFTVEEVYAKYLPKPARERVELLARAFREEQKNRRKNRSGSPRYWLLTSKDLMAQLLTYIAEKDEPVSVPELASEFVVSRSTIRRVLEKAVRDPVILLEKKVLINTRGKLALYGLDFPDHLDRKCGGCHFYVPPGLCEVWSTIGEINPQAVFSLYETRASLKFVESVFACEHYTSRLKKWYMSWRRFQDEFRIVTGATEEGETASYLCPQCEKEIEQPSSSPQTCGFCRTRVKLVRKKQISEVEITPDLDHVFQGIIHGVVGVLPDKLPVHTNQGILILETDEPVLEKDKLIVSMEEGRWEAELGKLTYIVTRRRLPRGVLKAAKRCGVKIYYSRKVESAPITKITSGLRRAVEFTRETGALAQALTLSNILSRAGFALALSEMVGEADGTAWHILDFYLRALGTLDPELLRSYEGLAGVHMWAQVKEVMNQKRFNLTSRVAERWVRETLSKPGVRIAAYSDSNCLINYVFLQCVLELRKLTGQTGLGYIGTSGVIHHRQSKSALDAIGLVLDLTDNFKLVYLLKLLEAIKTDQITPQDVDYFYGRARKKIYYVRRDALPKLEELCSNAERVPVYYADQERPLVEAYQMFVTQFERFLGKLLVFGATSTIKYDGQHVSYVKIARDTDAIRRVHPDIVRRMENEVKQFVKTQFSPFIFAPSLKILNTVLNRGEVVEEWVTPYQTHIKKEGRGVIKPAFW